jgi:crossover junction endodeoxyribonuclease RuvC
MRILGIDPGYATTGFGLIESDRNSYKALRYGVVTTPAGLEFSQRLVMLYDDITELLETLRPDVVAIEELFWGTNITTGIGVSHGRGVILLAVAKCGIPMKEYTPMQVKQAVVGYGKAEKRQVMDMTRRLLKLDAVPRPDDAADALAIALCHGRTATSILSQFGRSLGRED